METVFKGIILRTRPLTESSLIVEVLSETEGRLSLVAKGARRPKSPFVGKLDLFHSIIFSYLRSKRSDLHTLREAKLTKTYSRFRTDIQMLFAASYAVNLIEKSTEADTPIPEVYHLFCGFIEWLHHDGPGRKNIFAFELKLLSTLGFEPEIEATFLGVGSQKVAEALLRWNWEETARVQISAEQE